MNILILTCNTGGGHNAVAASLTEAFRQRGADSRVLLRAVVALARQKGWTVVNCDATIVAERPKIGPHMPAIRASLAETLGVSEEVVNVKAKTNERMDAVGRMEGMMAQAVVLMSRMA